MSQLTLNEIAEIESLVAQGLVTTRKHPGLDLWILNYTPRMQYESAWTPVAEQCRGLIVDSDYNVIERPFGKFYNLGEKMELADLPDEIPRITEKIEGFEGVLYSDNGIPAITTRGSFVSVMAIWATQYIRNEGYTMDDFKEGYTYIFEIVEPTLCREQGLLVDYGDTEGCFLLAVRNTETGEENNHITEAKRLGLPYAREFEGSLDDAIAEMGIDMTVLEEGYVVKYQNGLRVKLKYDLYKELHRVLSGLTPKRILAMMIERGACAVVDGLDGIPDESFDRCKAIVAAIEGEQTRLIAEARRVYDIAKDLPTREDQAMLISRSPHKAVAFAMLNGKEYHHVALKQVKHTLTTIMVHPISL